MTGVTVEMFEDQEFKKKTMDKMWWYWSDSENVFNRIPYTSSTKILEKFDGDLILYKPTYREFLQELGTDAMRDNLHENVWVNALFADYKAIITEPAKFGGTAIGEYPNWCITDMRFPNEMEAIKERKGITIKVVRPQIETAEFKSLHQSETALDDAKFDYEITNDGSIEDLIKNVELVLTAEGIL